MKQDLDLEQFREELEKQIIGSLIVAPDGIHEIKNIIKINYFDLPEARKLYGMIEDLTERDKSVSLSVLKYNVPELADFMFSCINTIPSSKHIVSHAEILKQFQSEKELAKLGKKLVRGDHSGLDDILHKIIEMNEEFNNPGIEGNHVDAVKAFFEPDYEPNILKTGLNLFDLKYGGLFPELIIIAARPSAGKTALALTVSHYQAMTLKKTIIFYSIEMQAIDILLRLIANGCNISLHKLRRNDLNDYETRKVHDWLDNVYMKSSLIVRDISGLDEAQFYSLAMSDFKRYKPDCIYVDQLSSISCSNTNLSSREATMKTMKMFARLKKKLGIPVVVLVQLNRDIEKRTNSRPMMSDLREAGKIEEDADVIIAIDRPDIHSKSSFAVPFTHPYTKEDLGVAARGMADIIILKNRNDMVTFFRQNYEGDFVRFTDIEVTNRNKGFFDKEGF